MPQPISVGSLAVLITKYTHACVRLEDHGNVLVIDPGTWTESAALIGANAVLVTHEHEDHIDVLRLAALGVPVYAPAGADIEGVDFIPISPGAALTVAGFSIAVVGGQHAVIYDSLPRCPNVGYIVDDSIYHPGDSLHRPEQQIETLLVPAQGSWLKLVEAIDFVKAIAPRRAFPIHDGQLNDRGLESVNAWHSEYADSYRYLAPGESL
jgi:L-ascorbate metabolism protein UlaG (beta-lactamase superfamily)